jgi:hypothetical protein
MKSPLSPPLLKGDIGSSVALILVVQANSLTREVKRELDGVSWTSC